jgi:hypothetical protein
MDSSTETTQIDPTLLQGLLGDSNTSLIPESLVSTLTVGIIVLVILNALFVVFYVLGIVRKWKVQSAVLDMHKDLAEIKATLAKPQAERTTEPAPVDPIEKPVTIATDETQKPPVA